MKWLRRNEHEESPTLRTGFDLNLAAVAFNFFFSEIITIDKILFSSLVFEKEKEQSEDVNSVMC